jgi:hypothetical protein
MSAASVAALRAGVRTQSGLLELKLSIWAEAVTAIAKAKTVSKNVFFMIADFELLNNDLDKCIMFKEFSK